MGIFDIKGGWGFESWGEGSNVVSYQDNVLSMEHGFPIYPKPLTVNEL